MNRLSCERVWQAEAREDGRLDKRDLASFERHAAHCQDCTREIAALDNITQKMSQLPEPKRTDLEHRRARQELLRRANEGFLTDKPTPKPWKMWALAGAVALGSLGLIWQNTRNNALQAPVFDIADVSHAVWQTETNASTSHVMLRSGTAAFHVEHLQSAARFFVDMPDGRIEVRGTRFVVDVAEGKTRSVEVTEGTVWLDVPTYHGLLNAGERWPRSEMSRAIPESSVNVPHDSPPPQDKPEAIAEDAGAPDAAVSNPKTNAPPVVAPANSAESVVEIPAPVNSAAPPKDEAGPRFAEAMTAFTAGDDSRAEQLFANFIHDFPRDGRAEDAMFLRAKLRARRGDSAGAAAIAREYLRIFPRGFRKPEAERLAGETK